MGQLEELAQIAQSFPKLRIEIESGSTATMKGGKLKKEPYERVVFHIDGVNDSVTITDIAGAIMALRLAALLSGQLTEAVVVIDDTSPKQTRTRTPRKPAARRRTTPAEPPQDDAPPTEGGDRNRKDPTSFFANRPKVAPPKPESKVNAKPNKAGKKQPQGGTPPVSTGEQYQGNVAAESQFGKRQSRRGGSGQPPKVTSTSILGRV
jgi:hypothetical protein